LAFGKGRILFVDDDALTVQYLTRLLENLGYHAVGFSDCTEAWNVFLQEGGNFDLLITDFFMPQIAGDLFARKARDLRPDLPVLIFTGGDPEWIKEKLDGLSNVQIVQKPVEAKFFSWIILHTITQAAVPPSSLSPQPPL